MKRSAASSILATPVRTDKSVLGNWWWTIDRWVLGGILALVGFGLILMPAASPSVAERIDLPPFHFVHRHLMMLVPALGIMLVVSTLGRKSLWRLATLTLLGSMIAMLLVLVIGPEIKGATR